jgi:hypothetical protein
MNVSTSYRPLSSKASLKVLRVFGSSSTIKTLFLDSVDDSDVADDDNLCQVTYIGDALKGYIVNHTYFSHFLDKLVLMYHYRDNTILGLYAGVKENIALLQIVTAWFTAIIQDFLVLIAVFNDRQRTVVFTYLSLFICRVRK